MTQPIADVCTMAVLALVLVTVHSEETAAPCQNNTYKKGNDWGDGCPDGYEEITVDAECRAAGLCVGSALPSSSYSNRGGRSCGECKVSSGCCVEGFITLDGFSYGNNCYKPVCKKAEPRDQAVCPADEYNTGGFGAGCPDGYELINNDAECKAAGSCVGSAKPDFRWYDNRGGLACGECKVTSACCADNFVTLDGFSYGNDCYKPVCKKIASQSKAVCPVNEYKTGGFGADCPDGYELIKDNAECKAAGSCVGSAKPDFRWYDNRGGLACGECKVTSACCAENFVTLDGFSYGNDCYKPVCKKAGTQAKASASNHIASNAGTATKPVEDDMKAVVASALAEHGDSEASSSPRVLQWAIGVGIAFIVATFR